MSPSEWYFPRANAASFSLTHANAFQRRSNYDPVQCVYAAQNALNEPCTYSNSDGSSQYADAATKSNCFRYPRPVTGSEKESRASNGCRVRQARESPQSDNECGCGLLLIQAQIYDADAFTRTGFARSSTATGHTQLTRPSLYYRLQL